mmetsp:Transcript_21360/g.62278  ORF Transcript_21360/g.62278 Transcript_21360/m.62278 type:complete len:239 (-) Transcript_21360:624-1340(-)
MDGRHLPPRGGGRASCSFFSVHILAGGGASDECGDLPVSTIAVGAVPGGYGRRASTPPALAFLVDLTDVDQAQLHQRAPDVSQVLGGYRRRGAATPGAARLLLPVLLRSVFVSVSVSVSVSITVALVFVFSSISIGVTIGISGTFLLLAAAGPEHLLPERVRQFQGHMRPRRRRIAPLTLLLVVVLAIIAPLSGVLRRRGRRSRHRDGRPPEPSPSALMIRRHLPRLCLRRGPLLLGP